MPDLTAPTSPGAPAPAALTRSPLGAINATRGLAVAFLVVALIFAIVAKSLDDAFYLRLATEALIFGGLAMSVDLLLGCTGLLPLGQALFFGLGAYASALSLKTWGDSFWIAMAAGTIVAALVGVVAGLIAIRSKGVYFALISFGLAQVVSKIVFNTRQLGASDGIIGVPTATILPGIGSGDPLAFFLVTLAFIALLYAGLAYVMETPFGRQLAAIRTNQQRLEFIGFDPRRAKLAVFVLAAMIAGASGALYPMLRGFVSPELMFFQVSGNAVINVIVGGTGTLIGPLYGTALITALRSIIGSYTEHHQIVIGVMFIIVVIVAPKGLIGYAAALLQRRRRSAS
jgi:branched-chain amino acid transport system permease protein